MKRKIIEKMIKKNGIKNLRMMVEKSWEIGVRRFKRKRKEKNDGKKKRREEVIVGVDLKKLIIGFGRGIEIERFLKGKWEIIGIGKRIMIKWIIIDMRNKYLNFIRVF